jgi:hypothetical protein
VFVNKHSIWFRLSKWLKISSKNGLETPFWRIFIKEAALFSVGFALGLKKRDALLYFIYRYHVLEL